MLGYVLQHSGKHKHQELLKSNVRVWNSSAHQGSTQPFSEGLLWAVEGPHVARGCGEPKRWESCAAEGPRQGSYSVLAYLIAKRLSAAIDGVRNTLP